MKRDFQNISLLPVPKTNCLMKVNLDALIPREDFAIIDTKQKAAPILHTISIRDLESKVFFYSTLRKPDFQRETSDWKPTKICDLIQSFLNGDLIPSIILWSSGSSNFVIDGAHRLSALIAWVLDDYGDGNISKAFFGHYMQEEQIEIAEKTRRLIKKKIGSYSDYLFAISNKEKADKRILEGAEKLATLAIQLQWVQGDANKAETSFFKINESATPINDTEKLLLKARNKPNAIAARAILHSGTGHKYWSKFSEENQDKIEELAKDINDILFIPKLKPPIKTLDVPLAGKGYSSQTLALIFDLINITNPIDVEPKIILEDDETGIETINHLKKTKKILNRISGTDPSSLGLHPVIYFYSIGGRYQVTAFLAVVELIKNLEAKKDALKDFTIVRQNFEEFLVKYKNLVNQVVSNVGSGIKSYLRLEKLFSYIITSLMKSKEEKDIFEGIKEIKEISFLRQEETELEFSGSKNFTTSVKSAAFLRDALASAIRCNICGGYIHTNSITFDHKDRKRDGGLGNVENAKLTHPYCNDVFKR